MGDKSNANGQKKIRYRTRRNRRRRRRRNGRRRNGRKKSVSQKMKHWQEWDCSECQYHNEAKETKCLQCNKPFKYSEDIPEGKRLKQSEDQDGGDDDKIHEEESNGNISDDSYDNIILNHQDGVDNRPENLEEEQNDNEQSHYNETVHSVVDNV